MLRLEIAALYAGINILLLLALAYLVVAGRQRHKITLGDGGNADSFRQTAGLDAAVDTWIADILACSPLAVRATKQSAVGALHLSLADANRYVAPWEARRRMSDDAQEGPLAFSQKRKPNFQGK